MLTTEELKKPVTLNNGVFTFKLDHEFVNPIPLNSYLELMGHPKVGTILESTEGYYIIVGNARQDLAPDEEGEGWLWDRYSWFFINRIWSLECHNTLVTKDIVKIANER